MGLKSRFDFNFFDLSSKGLKLNLFFSSLVFFLYGIYTISDLAPRLISSYSSGVGDLPVNSGSRDDWDSVLISF